MKQEDLKNLKIEDLEEVTETFVCDEGKDMICWNHYKSIPKIETVYAFVSINCDFELPVLTGASCNSYKHCAEIPQPKMRDMNSLEVMEYLHTFQQWLNGNKKELLQCGFPFDDRLYECEFNNKLSEGHFDGGVVIINTGGDWFTYSQFQEAHNQNGFKFAVLKNGKIKEFKLPQIEV